MKYQNEVPAIFMYYEGRIMNYETITVKKKDHVATITLNRPEKMNAVTPHMVDELVVALREAVDDHDVMVVVLTGAGRAFCSGLDHSGFAGGGGEQGSPSQIAEGVRRVQRITLGLQKMGKPTIAMVNGATLGIGCDFAFACDMRVGSDNAYFRSGFIRVGAIPGAGGTWLYTRLMGLGRGLEFLFTGDALSAEAAERIGVLNKLVRADELEMETLKLAQKIAKGPPIAMRLTKMQAYKALEVGLEAALEMAATGQAVAMSTEDHREAATALREKREAEFKGR
jgi:enoyl-CoA hydratase/carnithine racemase